MLKVIIKIGFTNLVILLLSFAIFAQSTTKLDVLGKNYHCGNALHKFIAFGAELEEKPQNNLYVIYYESQHPRFGDALNLAKGIPLYLKKAYKIPENRVVLIDGGFRQKLEIEIWTVPENAEMPKPTPTLERKDIKFAKGKPYRTRDLSRCYEN